MARRRAPPTYSPSDASHAHRSRPPDLPYRLAAAGLAGSRAATVTGAHRATPTESLPQVGAAWLQDHTGAIELDQASSWSTRDVARSLYRMPTAFGASWQRPSASSPLTTSNCPETVHAAKLLQMAVAPIEDLTGALSCSIMLLSSLLCMSPPHAGWEPPHTHSLP